MKPVMLSFTLLLLAGCSSVLMKEPFPDSKLTAQEQNDLSGIWKVNDQIVHVEFTSNGVPWLATEEWDNKAFKLHTYRLHATKRNDALYLSMPTEPDGEPSNYFFAEVKPDNNQILMWVPDPEFIKKQIEKGTLKGKVSKDSKTQEIVLDTPAKDILALISTNSAVFDYKQPIIIRRPQ